MSTHHPLTRRTAGVLLGISVIATSLAGTAGAQPVVIPPGFDFFETDPAQTHFDLALPADFFGPGSDPFMGSIKFGGVPLETFGGHGVGDADTVVQRLAPATPPATIPIEIVALSLVSMEPLTVKNGTGTERWDVNVGLSPSQPSQGQMTIHQTSNEGGTFSSQLQVVPFFTFTRIPDGATRVLDGVVLPPQILQAEGVPWTFGCVLPALAVAGLNDGFCPSFDGGKVLTLEQALLATHGVRPAQPALQHFKCYTPDPTPFPERTVQLTDQFGTRQAQVTDRAQLCNPARKRAEPYSNRRAHLVCYTAPGPDLKTAVVVRNQFGSQRLQVGEAETLCVPSKKREIGDPFRKIRTPIDHFQCYAVEPLTSLLRVGTLGKVKLTDQFGIERVTVGPAVRLCAPVAKDGSQVKHPVNHLVCYGITGIDVNRKVEVKNQFERKELVARTPALLCVPSAKVVVP